MLTIPTHGYRAGLSVLAEQALIARWDAALRTLDRVGGRLVLADGWVELASLDGTERERHLLHAGDQLWCENGAEVPARRGLYHRSPYEWMLLADVPEASVATARWEGAVLGDTFELRTNEVTGIEHAVVLRSTPGGLPVLRLEAGEGGSVLARMSLPVGAQIVVRDGASVRRGDELAHGGYRKFRSREWGDDGFERLRALLGCGASRQRYETRAVIAPCAGFVRVERLASRELVLSVDTAEGLRVVRKLPGSGRWPVVRDGDYVQAGEALTDGTIDHHELLAVVGEAAFTEHLCEELADMFRWRGMQHDEAHVELVVREMLSRVRVTDAGETRLCEGEVLARDEALRENARARALGLREARCEVVLTGFGELGERPIAVER